MIKVRIENTETKEIKEFEGIGIVFAMPQQNGCNIGLQAGVTGSFSNPILKMLRKTINKVIKMVLEEG